MGGALGIDSWALEWLSEHEEFCWVVVPFTVKDQPKLAQSLYEKAKKVSELALPQSKQSYLARNRYMVDRSWAVIGFWSGKPGGTLYTLEYGLAKQRKSIRFRSKMPKVKDPFDSVFIQSDPAEPFAAYVGYRWYVPVRNIP